MKALQFPLSQTVATLGESEGGKTSYCIAKNFTPAYLLVAGKFTVPMSMWRHAVYVLPSEESKCNALNIQTQCSGYSLQMDVAY